MLKLLRCEYLKMKRSKMLLIGLAGTLIVPFFVVVRTVADCLIHPGKPISLFALYDNALVFLMLLIGPMVLTVLGSWIVGREYTDGTLKNLFVIPVSATALIAGKLLFFALLSLAFMGIVWLEILAAALVCSCFFTTEALSVLSALFFLIRMFFGGVLLWAAQTPFIWLAVRAKGSAAPLIAVTAVSLVNVVLSGSPAAEFYPWSAAYLLVRLSGSSGSRAVSAAVVTAVCLSGIAASLVQFGKEEL